MFVGLKSIAIVVVTGKTGIAEDYAVGLFDVRIKTDLAIVVTS